MADSLEKQMFDFAERLGSAAAFVEMGLSRLLIALENADLDSIERAAVENAILLFKQALERLNPPLRAAAKANIKAS